MKLKIVFLATAAALAANAAQAVNIDLNATVVASCALTSQVNGTMATSGTGTVLGSEETGGLAAAISVLSIGTSTVSIATPDLVAFPSSYSVSGQTVEVSYAGASGLSAVSQGYTTTGTTFAVGTIPLSVLTINGRVSNSNGFIPGGYTVQTVVTCS